MCIIYWSFIVKRGGIGFFEIMQFLSDFISDIIRRIKEWLETKESEYVNDNKILRSDKRKKERQLLNIIHLMILQ